MVICAKIVFSVATMAMMLMVTEPLFRGHLPQQFDGYVWFEETHAVTPLPTEAKDGTPETYPFGL